MTQNKINDAFRHYIIEKLKEDSEAGRLYLVLTYDAGKADGVQRKTNPRANYLSIESDANNIHRVITVEVKPEHLYTALKAEAGVSKPSGSDNITIMSELYYKSGETWDEGISENLWNAVYGTVPIPSENNPLNADYLNLISLVITEKDGLTVKIDEDTIIINQEYLTTKTTLPNEGEEVTLNFLVQL